MVILEFTTDRVKLLETARSRQRAVIKVLVKKSIAGLSDEAISAAVLDLINEAGIKKIPPLTICIPRHLVAVRNLRLPSSDEAELKDMARLQAGKQLPYPVEELIWDFIIIEKRQDGYSDIFLSIVPKNAVERFINILQNSKLQVDRIMLSSEALFAWYLSGAGFKSSGEAPGLEAVVDIDTSGVDVIVVKSGGLEFSRSFAFKENLEETAQEIGKTLSSYEKESSRRVPSIVLTGIEEKALGLKPLLEGAEGAGKIEFVHPLKIAAMDYREAMSEYIDLSRDISFCSILGITYNLPGITMDFLPLEFKEKNRRLQSKGRAIRTGMMLVAIITLLFGIFFKNLVEKNTQLDLIDLKIREAEPKVRHLKVMSQNIEIVKQHLDAKGSSVDVLREVYKIIPQEVSLSLLDFELERSLALRGVSTDLSSVFKFVSELEGSVYFENCQIKYAQKRRLKEKEFVDFEIDIKLSRAMK